MISNASGPINSIWCLASINSLYSPPQASRYPGGKDFSKSPDPGNGCRCEVRFIRKLRSRGSEVLIQSLSAVQELKTQSQRLRWFVRPGEETTTGAWWRTTTTGAWWRTTFTPIIPTCSLRASGSAHRQGNRHECLRRDEKWHSRL